MAFFCYKRSTVDVFGLVIRIPFTLPIKKFLFYLNDRCALFRNGIMMHIFGDCICSSVDI